ncbi:VPA1262 family N-terminal domain-containing protein [Fibrobacter sp. UWB7]|uniref:VPA1262 family N-terminal domain-containing protein n=1 Tax=Fibrobacter sp. UWB7 TaxID=1896206 RepID=UPI000912C798|nr:VPA1262 family N-terminal domain-containing protein [Fibrobacter sp. UWB7]SHM93710.1 hypothetical protein SAMN05720467_2795 [Fibrobacter sp. UWB7]
MMHDYKQERIIERKTKANIANSDFDILLQEDVIAFYETCEMTQIFLYDEELKKVQNYYTLFVFEEIPNNENKEKYLFPKLQKIDKRYKFGIIQKRLSVEEAKVQFKNIQQQQKIIFGNENCEISSQMVLLPKSFVPLYYGSTTPMLSNVLKKNFWGASYIIEFFDEKKDFVIEENERAKIDFINKTVKSVIDIDLAKVSDRIGNVVFQFPITIMDLNTLLIKPGAEIRTIVKPHVKSKIEKNISIQIQTSFNNTITGYDSQHFKNLDFAFDSQIGDDNNVRTTVFDFENKVVLYDCETNFIRTIHTTMQMAGAIPPRTIAQEDGSIKEISLVYTTPINVGLSLESDYNNRILKRSWNDEVLKKSGDFKVLKGNESDKALDFIRKKIIQSDAKEICLWDPYLSAQDIMNTLYYEPSGKIFRCITCVATANLLSRKNGVLGGYEKLCRDHGYTFKRIVQNDGFEVLCKNVKAEFKKSNNLNVNLKFLAQHDNYGWKFHDRFLILVPYDSSRLPEVYSLGISVNQIGEKHHIIQKVTDSREILNNFEELWHELDNDACCVVEFPKMKDAL